MDMLVKMAAVLVKIAVMMMAPGSAPAPPEARGREPPCSSSSLTFSLDGRRVSLWSLAPMAWEGREPLRDWIYLSVSAFSDSTPSPFLKYPEIRNYDWGESFAQILLIKLAFLHQKKSINRLMGAPGESRARLPPWARPLSPAPLGHRLALILPPENPKYSKIILRPFLSRLDSV